MRARRFTQLANHLGLQQARAFSQKTWRQDVYVWDPGTLCSGLCYLWLIKRLENQSLLSDLETEPSLPYFGFLLDEIHRLQRLSYYPEFPKNYTPDQSDLQLFVAKYGTSDWQGIKRLVQQEYQGNYVLYDLSSNYDFEDANIVRFSSMPDSLSQATFLEVNLGQGANQGANLLDVECGVPPRTAVLGVLRFGQEDSAGDKHEDDMFMFPENNSQCDVSPISTSSGHQFVYYLDEDGCHHFFDPDAGEVIESDSDRFFSWLNMYLIAADYAQKPELPNVPFMTLYQLHGLSSRAARLSCSSLKAS